MVAMKTITWVKLILIAWITFSVTAVSIAAEWGTVMYAHQNTLIREKRSVKSRIKGRLAENQAVKADFFKNGWYAVFSLTEKKRKESKALGYVYKMRLSADRPKSVETIPENKKQEDVSAESNQDLDVDVKNISLNIANNDNEKESIFIEFNRFYTPAISSIEGNEPRIVLDLENVSSFKKEWAMINVGGKYIKRIRSSMDPKTRKARIVLDLEPFKDYFIQPHFGKKENIYSLEVSADVNK